MFKIPIHKVEGAICKNLATCRIHSPDKQGAAYHLSRSGITYHPTLRQTPAPRAEGMGGGELVSMLTLLNTVQRRL